MPNEQLLAYIRAERAQGTGREAVTHALLAANWRIEDINAAFSAIEGTLNQGVPSAPQAPAASSTETLRDRYPLSPRKFWKKIIAVILPFAIFSFFVAVSVDAIIALTRQSSNSFTPLLGIGFVGFFCVFMSLYAWYVKVYIRRYFYDATESYITIKKGVFAPAEIHVQYAKIQDVYVDQDIIDRVMGLYDVHLASATAASGIEAHIDGVEQVAAEGLKNLLLQKLQSGGSVADRPIMSPVQPVSRPAAFATEISSATYPITGAWYAQQMIRWFFSALFISLIIDLQLVSRGRSGSSSLMETFGWGSSALWLVFFGSFVVIYAFHLVYMVLWRSTYSFSFLPDYIVTKQGVIAKTENHLPYRAVQDVAVSQGIIERLLGIATVRIENAAAAQVVGRTVVSSAVLIPGQSLARANEISDAIKHVTLAKNSSQTGL
ncbi:MAG: PH domain-containing protein [Candidatus Paceibacterota bacterium]|jgi:membrane protein YdbS with pleckstrin-like domain